MPFLIHGVPQIVALALNRQKHLVQVPFVTRSGTTASQPVGIVLTEFPTPFAD
jgi:hypothetical protein